MTTDRPTLAPAGAILLTGGTAVRLDGVDKAGLEVGGQTLLELALGALADVAEVVVVGDEIPTSRPVTFRREEPPGGGPVAGLLAGLAGFPRRPDRVALLAVDMPRVTRETFRRLARGWAEVDADAVVLRDSTGRRQPLCGIYATGSLPRPDSGEDGRGWSMHRLLEPLRVREVPAEPGEADDVDTWDDLRRIRDEYQALASREGLRQDWGP